MTNSSFAFNDTGSFTVNLILLFCGAVLYIPVWLYRVTIKSTAWFWWPLAFLGDDLQRARNPTLFKWDFVDSLWAKASIVTACASLLAFAATNFVLNGAVFQRNPLLTPLGYLLLVDWTMRPWQAFALFGSALSIVLVFWLDYVSGKYRIAQDTHDAELIRAEERNFGWIERLARLRLIVVILFWCLVGAHAMLYVNGTRCWFSLPPSLHKWAQDIYGDRLPSDDCPKHQDAGAQPRLGRAALAWSTGSLSEAMDIIRRATELDAWFCKSSIFFSKSPKVLGRSRPPDATVSKERQGDLILSSKRRDLRISSDTVGKNHLARADI